MPDLPNYLPQLVNELQKEGAPKDVIDHFSAYWKSLPPDAGELPCPFCFVADSKGRLTVLASNGADVVRCNTCWAEVIIDRHQ